MQNCGLSFIFCLWQKFGMCNLKKMRNMQHKYLFCNRQNTLFKIAKSPVFRCPSLPYVGNSSFHVAMLKTVKGKNFGGRNKKLRIYFQFLAILLQKLYINDYRICRWHYLQTFIPMMEFLVYFLWFKVLIDFVASN